MDILKDITFHLCDFNQELIEMWTLYFGDMVNFKFYNCDIFSVPIPIDTINAIVSPSNSFGDLQGGIDFIYFKKFGYKLEEQLQQTIIEKKFGELIIGDALILEMNKFYNYQYFIAAPTMRVPMCVDKSVNAYLAFRATLIELIKFNTNNESYKINHVVCPGLATGIGKIPAELCARQMFQAYNIIINPSYYLDLARNSCEHVLMTEIQESEEE
jgi:O-acetyl-ADP-ribose deacetylase (regulator of RNase III)